MGASSDYDQRASRHPTVHTPWGGFLERTAERLDPIAKCVKAAI
jgi:hypothetical protein